MQNRSHSGFVLGNTPNARIFHGGYQHVGIYKACGANANPKICVAPKCKPPTQVSGIEVALGLLVLGLTLAMYISSLCQFHLRWVPKANAFSVEYGLKAILGEFFRPKNLTKSIFFVEKELLLFLTIIFRLGTMHFDSPYAIMLCNCQLQVCHMNWEIERSQGIWKLTRGHRTFLSIIEVHMFSDYF